MRIFVSAKPAAKKDEVVQLDATHFKVSVKAPPQNGKANSAVEKVLAEFLELVPSRVKIIKGHTSKNKTVEII